MKFDVRKDTAGKPWLFMFSEIEAEQYQLQKMKGLFLWSNTSFEEVKENENDLFAIKIEIKGSDQE